jgi:YVTN family beta-propeller protein
VAGFFYVWETELFMRSLLIRFLILLGFLFHGFASATPVVPKFAYVVNQFSNTVSVYTIDPTTGALTAGTPATVATGNSPSSMAVDPSGKFAYVTNSADNTVSVYTINQTTGALTAGNTVASGNSPQSVAVDPNGRFVYVINWNSNSVSVYTIDQTTGALTAGTAVLTVNAPNQVSVEPTGKFAYITSSPSFNTYRVTEYAIDQTTGALTAGTFIATGANPGALVFDPSGKFAYVENRAGSSISVYTVNQATGALTAGTTVATGGGPMSATVDPSGKFVYVVNSSVNRISAYSINPTTGALTAGPVLAAVVPMSVNVDPSGKFAYVTYGAKTIQTYTVDPSTGALTAGVTLPTQNGPIKVVTTGIASEPGAATIGTATAGPAQATVSFTAPTDNGRSPITGYTVTSAPDGIYATGAASPITVSGLAAGTSYTFTVTATNSVGTSVASLPSNSVIPTMADQVLRLVTPQAVVSGGSARVFADASSGLAVSLTSLTPNICTLSNARVVGISAGICTLAVDQLGDTTYHTAPQVTQSITIAAGVVAPKFAYVANIFSNTVSVYSIDAFTGVLTPGTPVTAGTQPKSVTVDPGGNFAYVANGGGTVSVFGIDQTTGALTVGTPVTTGTNPASVTVDPRGKFAYVTNVGSNSVSVYTIDPTTGGLTAGAAVTTGRSPTSIGVDPGGRFAYVTNSGDNTVSVFKINPVSGALIAGTAVAAGSYPFKVAVDPSGKLAYVANYNGSTISVYSIDQTTGALTTGTAVAAGTFPNSIAIDPRGKFVYVTNQGTTNVSVYTIDPTTGALTAGTAVVTAASPSSVIVDPSGKFAYITNSGNPAGVTVYTIDPTTGALTAGTAVGAGTYPNSVITTGGIVASSQSGTTLNLVAGWNLLGNSVEASMDVATTFGDATNFVSVWKWIPGNKRWAFYAPSMTTSLATYAASKGYDVLTSISGGEGFWVNANSPMTVSLPMGTAISATKFADQSTAPNNLPSSWSLIAVGDSPSPRGFVNAIAVSQPVSPVVAATSLTTLWAWDSSAKNWEFYAPNLDNSGGLASYITGKNYLDFGSKVLDPGMGFWVNHP